MSAPNDKELLTSHSSRTDNPDLEKGEATPEKEEVADHQACHPKLFDTHLI